MPAALVALGVIFVVTGVVLYALTHPVSDQQSSALYFFVGVFVGIGLVLLSKGVIAWRKSKRA